MQSGLDAFVIIWLRLFVAGIFFTAMSATLPKEKHINFNKRDILILFLCGLFGSVLNQIFFYYGLKITQPINASIFNLLNPITIIVLSYFLLKESITKITLGGFAIALLGCAFLLDTGSFSLSGSTFWGDIFVVINAIFFGTYVVLVSKLSGRFHPFVISKWMLIIGIILTTPLSWGALSTTHWTLIEPNVWTAIAFIIIFNTIIAYWITNYLPSITSPYIMGMYVYAQPFATSLFAIALGQDELNTKKVFCGLMIILGIYLAQYGRKRASKTLID